MCAEQKRQPRKRRDTEESPLCAFLERIFHNGFEEPVRFFGLLADKIRDEGAVRVRCHRCLVRRWRLVARSRVFPLAPVKWLNTFEAATRLLQQGDNSNQWGASETTANGRIRPGYLSLPKLRLQNEDSLRGLTPH
ncbi:uncharacterized protein TM35_000401180 [Trypanosoma theileri]|uniref:Uncharacterized protein n=1 Tax=Trypanosoma theileri TaxID=67003 RepID=A0A1X0NJT0_9TRYP|nr:uncharacterized protein TM35_000401180 [Trypanosoma theileri]ORC84851.1 hypothetical protein TM35_000401180 [Trypanosoma theileri]